MKGALVLAIAACSIASGVTVSAAFHLVLKPGAVSPLLAETTDLGRAPATDRHKIVIALGLRNRPALEALLADVQDPRSPNRQRFLTQDEFNELHAPTVVDEEAVVSYLVANRFRIVARFPNRLLVGAIGSVAAIERAFAVEMHTVLRDRRRHYAAVNEPSFPADLAPVIVGVIGLDDLNEMHSRLQASGEPHASLGSNCCHFSPNDVATFYDNTAGDDGTGQTIVIAGAFAWQDSDNTSFNGQWGLPSFPTGSGQICTGSAGSIGCQFSSRDSIEIALDAEYAHGVAPGARILNYMAASTSTDDFTSMYTRIVTDNPGHVVSTSWGSCESDLPSSLQQADDNIFANANAIGQSWLAASGDGGSRDCRNVLTVDHPANSPHVMGVGGTTPTCSGGMTPPNPACAGYGAEVGWSGSGGGISQVFPRPAFQSGCGVPPGSQRLVPDIALEADVSPGNYVLEGGQWFIVGGTSDAAPQWAGFAAELNQRLGGAGLGNPGARLYGLCGTSAFHDIMSGSNGDYSAGPGYDLVTGLGTIEARNLLALSAPSTTTTTPTATSTTMAVTTTTLPCATPTLGCPQAVTPNATFVADVAVNVLPPRALGAYSFRLTWNPTQVRVDSVSGGTTSEFSGTPTCSIDNTSGTATCSAFQASNPSGPTGSVHVARVNATAIATGGTMPTLTLTLLTLFDTKDRAICIAGSPNACTINISDRCGDVNGDGVVNVGDALLVAQFTVGLRMCGVAPFSNPSLCDINLDNTCNIGDALRMAQCDVGLIGCAFTCRVFTCP